MERVARLILILTVLACALLLFLAFFRGEDPTSNKTKNETVALSLMKRDGISKELARNYYQAGKKKGVDWRLLAAIGFAESDHGRSPLPGVNSGINAAGCCSGMMQLCVVSDCGDVWSDYAVDGNDNRQKSPYEKADSIFTAAAYLSWMQSFLGQNPERLAAAYNAGPTLVANEGIPAYPETQAYLKKVRRVYNSLQKNAWKKIS